MLTLATCQFPIERDVAQNAKHIERLMRSARKRGADVAHFAECALSGYAGVDFESFAGFDWELLRNRTKRIQALARELRLWVILGSSHRLSRRHKPHNSLYVIDTRGKIVDRYDKRFCTGNEVENWGDLAHYSPGDHFVLFTVRGVRCGLLLCHDFRYPELYRAYKKLGAQVMFHSFHNARVSRKMFAFRKNVWGKVLPPIMQSYAANNAMWISSNNSTTPICCWPSFVVRPDGIVASRLGTTRTGLLVTKINPRDDWYDPCDFRDQAMRGELNSGTLVKDRRSTDRKTL